MNPRLRLAVLTATAVGILAVSLVADAQPAPGFTVAPTFLNFLDQPVNQASPSQQVTITNSFDVPVPISSITLAGQNPQNFSVTGNCGASLAPFTSCVENVVFTPLFISSSRATLDVTATAPGSPQTVSLFGNGTAAIVQIAPAVITTFAGTGTAGFRGDNGPATAAQLKNPKGVFLDQLGNIYFADSANNVIRGINPAGNIFTFAGNGTAGFSGDGAAATAAQLNAPTDIAFDSAGNAYIADQQNQRIRLVSPQGIISTFAGTGAVGYTGDLKPASQATFNLPSSLAFDSLGSLVIADRGNHVLRAIDSSGIISTFAGTGVAGYTGDGGLPTNATLNSPAFVRCDHNANTFVADQGNHVIRVINNQDNTVITTFAGDGTAGSTGDGGSATGAEISNPNGLGLDQGGNLYIADSASNNVRKVDAAGVITTVAGNGTAGNTGDNGPATLAQLSGPGGIGVDLAGPFYVADSLNNVIRKIGPAGALAFANTNVLQSTAAQTLTLVNIGNIPVTLPTSNQWTPTGSAADYQIAGPCTNGPTLAANASCALQVIFTPTAVGVRTLTYSIIDSAIGGGQQLQFSGTGVALAQTITFPAIPNHIFGVPPFTLNATATSQLPVIYTVVSGPATVTGAVVTLTGPGTVTIQADQPGNATFAPAAPVRQSFAVTQTAQTITFPAIPNHIFGDPPFTLNAIASSQLPVIYTVVSGPATVAGPTVTLTGAGTVTIRADQPGNTTFAPAAPVQQTFSVARPNPTLVSISPSSATLGSAAITITLTGTSFSTADIVQLNGAAIATTFASVTSLTATIPATFLAQAGTGLISVLDTNTKLVTSALPFTVNAPPVNIILTGPPTAPSGQQPILTFQLVNPYPAPLIGTFTLAFQPDPKTNVDDPSVQFAGGGRAFNFGIPANSTVTPTLQIQTGTVAGTAVISLQVTTNGVNVTPSNLAPVVINIPEAAPVLNSTTATRNGDLITITVQGFSNTREVTQAKFHFAGETFKNPNITIDVTTLFANWYADETSLQFGSSFRYTQSFTLSSNAANVKTVTVTLDNSIGTSTAVVAQ